MLRNDSEWPGNFRKNVRRFEELIAFVRRANNSAKARFAFRNRWIAHSRREDAGFKNFPGEFECFCGVADMNRNDRRLAGLELEATLFQLSLEHFCVGPQFFDQLFALCGIEKRKSGLAGANRGRGMRRGKK